MQTPESQAMEAAASQILTEPLCAEDVECISRAVGAERLSDLLAEAATGIVRGKRKGDMQSVIAWALLLVYTGWRARGNLDSGRELETMLGVRQ